MELEKARGNSFVFKWNQKYQHELVVFNILTYTQKIGRDMCGMCVPRFPLKGPRSILLGTHKGRSILSPLNRTWLLGEMMESGAEAGKVQADVPRSEKVLIQ